MLCTMCGKREATGKIEVCSKCDFIISVDSDRVEHLTNFHTPHCAARIVYGDGECECRGFPKRDKLAERIYFCSPSEIPGYRPFTMEYMVESFNRIHCPGLVTGVRRQWRLPPRYEVVCPKCGEKTNSVIDYLGKLYFQCKDLVGCNKCW